jgi:tetratricopeptide (TPR) repeat protein
MVPSRSRASRSGRPAPQRERQVSGPVARNHVPDKRSILSDAVTQSIAKRRYDDALGCIMKLVALEPAEPRWHQKYGEVLRTLGRHKEAAAAYRRAASRYELTALPARASALLRVAETLEGGSASTPPTRVSTDRLRATPFVPADESATGSTPTDE